MGLVLTLVVAAVVVAETGARARAGREFVVGAWPCHSRRLI